MALVNPDSVPDHEDLVVQVMRSMRDNFGHEYVSNERTHFVKLYGGPGNHIDLHTRRKSDSKDFYFNAKAWLNPRTGKVSLNDKVVWGFEQLWDDFQINVLLPTEDGRVDYVKWILKNGLFEWRPQLPHRSDGDYYLYHPRNSRAFWRPVETTAT